METKNTTPGRACFEVACEIAWWTCRTELFLELGVKETMKRSAAALAAAGWTSLELCKESERRMREFIKSKSVDGSVERL